MSCYQQKIRETMAAAGHIGAADPRHVEAWMRLEHGCFDGLSPVQFTHEVEVAMGCIAAGPVSDSEALATSYGL